MGQSTPHHYIDKFSAEVAERFKLHVAAAIQTVDKAAAHDASPAQLQQALEAIAAAATLSADSARMLADMRAVMSSDGTTGDGA